MEAWKRLERRGGFPEPFSRDRDLHQNRWSSRRRELLIRQDLRELSQIKQLSLVEHLSLLLPGRVGSPLSLNSLRGELGVAFDTIKSWVEALERLYYCFRILPYSRKLARSLRKEHKLYLWDWSQVEDPGARFENQVASHLYKAVQLWTDLGHGNFELRYWRSLEKQEVDFIVTRNGRPVAILEAKRGDRSPSVALDRLGQQLEKSLGAAPPAVQLIDLPGQDEKRGRVRVVHAAKYLAGLV